MSIWGFSFKYLFTDSDTVCLSQSIGPKQNKTKKDNSLLDFNLIVPTGICWRQIAKGLDLSFSLMRLGVWRPIIVEAKCMMCPSFVPLVTESMYSSTEGFVAQCSGRGETVGEYLWVLIAVLEGSFSVSLCCLELYQDSTVWLSMMIQDWGEGCVNIMSLELTLKMIVLTPLSKVCYWAVTVRSRIGVWKEC